MEKSNADDLTDSILAAIKISNDARNEKEELYMEMVMREKDEREWDWMEKSTYQCIYSMFSSSVYFWYIIHKKSNFKENISFGHIIYLVRFVYQSQKKFPKHLIFFLSTETSIRIFQFTKYMSSPEKCRPKKM